MSRKKFYVLGLTLIIVIAAVFLIRLFVSQPASETFSDAHLYSASGRVIEIKPDENEVVLKLKQKYVDDFSGNEIITLRWMPSLVISEQVSQLYEGQFVTFSYFPGSANGNVVEDIYGFEVSPKIRTM